MAKKSTSKFRLGAVLAKRNDILSCGFNQMKKTHPLQQRYHIGEGILGLHAEVHACIGIPAADLLGAEMFVARILRDGSVAMAMPCATCCRFMSHVGIVKVTFTTGTGIKEIEL